MRISAMALGIAAAMMATGCETLDEDYGYEYERAGPDEIVAPAWAERSPTARQIHDAYPIQALIQGVTARVILLCSVTPARALSCAVEDEGVPGWGFGAAALKVSQLFLVKPDVVPVGQKVRVPIRFALPDV